MSVETVTTYVGLGSNLGDRAGNLLLAVRGLIEASICIRRMSAIYETEAVETLNQQTNFLNMVVEAEVNNVSPEQMLARMLRVEYLLGRRREFENSPRTVDLDLLLFGEAVHKSDIVTVPHPRIHLRRFVLVPLNEIAPSFKHPVFNKTIAKLLEETPDKSNVKRWNPLRSDFELSTKPQFSIANKGSNI